MFLKHLVIKSCRIVTVLLLSPTHVMAWHQCHAFLHDGHDCGFGPAHSRFCDNRSLVTNCALERVYSSSVGSITCPSPAFARHIMTARSVMGNACNWSALFAVKWVWVSLR
eukprot:Lithocolla_globosa_v1_NODE_405_length_4144_cov_33.349474.p4 type:complete len:111 gc:universal NODE_405_length_4144_cov_33.349474:3555-3223(-)